MRNVFFTSLRRQPVRGVLLSVLVAVATFAFVARVTEFVIVSEEIDRIEGEYSSIGILAPIRPDDITGGHDVRGLADIVAASPLVEREDRRVFTQGVLHDNRNATTMPGITPDFFNPAAEGIDMDAMEFYFLASPIFSLASPVMVRDNFRNHIHILLDVQEIIAGDPRTLFAGRREFLTANDRVAVVNSRTSMYLLLTDEEADLFEAGLFDPLAGVIEGEQFLFRATPTLDIVFQGTFLEWVLRPLCGGVDGIKTAVINPIWGFVGTVLDDDAPRDDDLVFYLNPRLPIDADFQAQLQENIDLAYENISSMMVVGTQDMTAMLRFQSPLTGRLIDGRWLGFYDYYHQNPVAVVPIGMAARRGLVVGETFTITLKDMARPEWIDAEHDNYRWSPLIEGWWHPAPQGFWALNEGIYLDERNSRTITLEVVGVYMNIPPAGVRRHTFLNNEMFVPLSLMPAGFEWAESPMLSTMYSFTLDSPRSEDAFLAEYGERLRLMGFMPRFAASGFEAFAASADPIRTSITVNLIIFSVVSVFILFLVVFLYVRQWRQAVAISRALGSPANKTLVQMFTPVLAMWTPAIVAGVVAAWFFAISQAQSSLGTLLEDGAVITRSYNEMVLLFVIMAVAVFGMLFFAGSALTRRPVLAQLQGTSAAKTPKRKKTVQAVDEPQVFAMKKINVPPKPSTFSKSASKAANFKFIGRHIFRSPIKSALIAVVALFFVVSLGWMHNTILVTEAEIAYLWDNTIVSGTVTRSVDDDRVLRGFQSYFGHAPITQDVVDHFLASGFVDTLYLEALWMFDYELILGVSDFYAFVEHNTRTPLDDALGVLGEDIEIEFAHGYSSADFHFGGTDASVPIIIRSKSRQSRLIDSDPLRLSDPDIPVHIIGYFAEGVHRGANSLGLDSNIIIMPFAALFYHTFDSIHFDEEYGLGLGGLTYKTMNVFLNPARNREVHELEPMVEGVLAANEVGQLIGRLPLEFFMNDGELRNMVEPMEQNLNLLRLLYPIAIAVAAVLSVGLSLLVMLQNAKNAAIMRVLGKTKTRAKVTLCGEQVMVCVIGVILGIGALFAIGVQAFDIAPVMLAVMYFAGSIIGSIVGAIIISGKTPMELLQVKE
ncbi:MAG: ABC transporter permease [Defluviitaleaceae bacterium]|nr:ABC transporter permease [Defluviitaleaceae bacterium]